MTTPTLLVAELLAAAVQAAWNPTAPDAVAWDFFRRWSDLDKAASDTLLGRQVVFFPSDYGKQSEDRGEDRYTHRITALVVERYTGAGDPTRAWTAERVDFVHERIVKGLWYTRDRAAANRNLMSVSADAAVCDTDKLTGANKLFAAEVQLVYDEIRVP